ncbi:FAD-dependent oxidoreductase [Adlercreutzia sp. ZJ141]|uniref:FAD-dependent oxidoreductase n=1 Tax=Adlercreutzia sp. ZJ141 TaxID=2709406 RepID=UPI0013EA7147|nr:FAD-dependent oxidoreductase [Adlercreutzia sp. ZJ141]
MEERDFDIIVVGCGCAGAIAAYVAAKQSKSVLVVERGEFAGAKNMTGGRLYTHSLRAVLEAYADGEVDWDDIPFERKITHERMSLLGTSSAMTVDYTSEAFGREGQESYSVLRATFDQWLFDLAESAGCEMITGIAVESLVKDESGAVIGVKAGDDEITAQVVIIAEGQNSLLTERELGAPRPKTNQMAVGIKEVFALDSDVIGDRFLCQKDEGAAMLFVGDCTHGVVGGGFMYANKESVSLGLVSTISEMEKADTTIYQAMEDFKHHPAVAPIIRGAEMVEHSGHMVAEGGFNMIPRYVYDGALVAGDAAMLCMNLGYMVRGMDLAIASGRFAAETACEAIDNHDVSTKGLSSYQSRLENSFVVKDMKTFKEWPETMERWDSMFSDYPQMVGELFDTMFVVDGTPMKPLGKRMFPIIKRRGLLKLAGEVRRALRAL